jgi:hypothetical protein
VHGAFPVQTPPVNLGFKQLHDGASTLLTLYITLRPQLAVPQQVMVSDMSRSRFAESFPIECINITLISRCPHVIKSAYQNSSSVEQMMTEVPLSERI